jgi:uncharacterized protein (TIGR04255 family)
VARHPVLARAPLRTVVCQVKFPRILGISDQQVRPLQQRVSKTYPEYVPGEVQEFVVGPGLIKQAPDVEKLHQIRSADGLWAVNVVADALSLETTKFPGFEEFSGRWKAVLSDAVEVLEIGYQDRLGLRFVNEIEMPSIEALPRIRAMINPELIAPVGSHPLLEDLVVSLQELRFKQSDGQCTLRHGYVLKVEGTRAYILDLDYYDDAKKDMSVDSNLRALDQFNDGVYEIFRFCITDDAYLSFEPSNAVEGQHE